MFVIQNYRWIKYGRVRTPLGVSGRPEVEPFTMSPVAITSIYVCACVYMMVSEFRSKDEAAEAV